MATPLPADAAPAAPNPDAHYTGDMVRALNEANPHWWPRYETVDGRLLVTPAPKFPHQTVAQRLAFELGTYLERFPVGEVLMGPADISFGRPGEVVVQPDLYVLPADVLPAIRASGEWADARRLLLACEVLSPRTRTRDRTVKRALYQREGVPTYWVVDPGPRLVEVYTPAAAVPRVEPERLTWHPDGAAEPLVVEFARLFRGF